MQVDTKSRTPRFHLSYHPDKWFLIQYEWFLFDISEAIYLFNNTCTYVEQGYIVV